MNKELRFTKMHGLGNDYIYINCLKDSLDDPAAIAVKVSNRRFSVGADGLVMILPSKIADFKMRIFNADGSEAEMCGNAVRCIAKYVYERELTTKTDFTLETLGGQRDVKLVLENSSVKTITVNMGKPSFKSVDIPVTNDQELAVNISVPIDGKQLKGTCVNVGNPHIVFFTDEITDYQVLTLGPKIEKSAIFPNRTNVEFASINSPNEITMRVWERGSGETLACGTAAAATLAAAVYNNLSERKVIIHLLGGDLELDWAEDNCIYQTGPAAFVCDGNVYL